MIRKMQGPLMTGFTVVPGSDQAGISLLSHKITLFDWSVSMSIRRVWVIIKKRQRLSSIRKTIILLPWRKHGGIYHIAQVLCLVAMGSSEGTGPGDAVGWTRMSGKVMTDLSITMTVMVGLNACGLGTGERPIMKVSWLGSAADYPNRIKRLIKYFIGT